MSLPLIISLSWGTGFSEDVFITLRYAKNLASDQGLIYWPMGNSTIPPLTSPFLSFLLSLFIDAGFDMLKFAVVVSSLGWSSAIFSFRSIGNARNLQKGAFASAFLLAVNPWIIPTLGDMTSWIIAICWVTMALIIQRRFLLSFFTFVAGSLLLIPWPLAFPWPHLTGYLWPLLWSIFIFTAGFGAQWLGEILSRRGLLRTDENQTITILLSFPLLILGTFQLVSLWRDFQFRPLKTWNIENEIASWLKTETQPGSTIVVSEKIGYLASRQAVPYHQLPYPLERIAIQNDNLPTHIVANRSLEWQNITTSPWFHLNYMLVNKFGEPTVAIGPYSIWEYRKPLDNFEQRQALNARVPDRMRLLGYQLGPYLSSPGNPVDMALYFQIPKFVNRQLDSFEAIIRLNSHIDDSEQSSWEISIPHSDQWQPDQVFIEIVTLPLPQSLEVGAYQFNISFRGAPDEELWPISLDNDINRLDRIPLGDIVIPWKGEMTNTESQDSNFADKIQLIGFNISNDPMNSILDVNLYWQQLGIIDQDYTIFVHVIDQHGNLVANHDGQPANGRFPTSTWRGEITIEDQHHINLPKSLPAGEYQIIIGVYLPETGERLDIVENNDSSSMGDSLLLDQIFLPAK